MRARISGTGSCIPLHRLDNEAISRMVDTSDAWIRERTGIESRHVICEESTVSMAAEAAERALQNAGMDPEEIDMILVSMISSEVILPCTACEVQRRIGAVNAAGFDINAACAGFLVAYQTAEMYIASGMYRNILVIGSEGLSHLVNWKDRGTCILFGDGAGAAVVTSQSGERLEGACHSDGKKGTALTCRTRYNEDEMPDDRCYMQMDGQAVFRFAVKKVPEVIEEVLEKNHLSKDEIDWFILHQANGRILESVARRLEVGIEKFPMNLQEYGNTSSASVPILLDEMNRKGCLKPGQNIVMAAFGAGLTWGASIIQWQ